jgi:hypothetical protein
MLLYSSSNLHATHACLPYDVYDPRGGGGAYVGRRAAGISGVPLILRAMLDDDERVGRYILAFDVPIFRP